MSKRAFKRYLEESPKEELAEQLLSLYSKYKPVKKYYDFIFNPQEEKLVNEAKVKVSNEYFPLRRKRPRARPSVAQNFIKEFKNLEMQPSWVAELMVYNLEVAHTFSIQRARPDKFYKSMLNSFKEAVRYVNYHSLRDQYFERLRVFYKATLDSGWPFEEEFARVADDLEHPQ